MCCDCCCCCCEKEQEITISGIVINAIAVIFLIWGVADMVWFKKAEKGLYITGFVFLILTLLGFIGILVLIILRKPDNERQFNQIAKYISITILVLVTISLVLIIIGELVLIINYAKEQIDRNDLEDEYYYFNNDFDIPTRWWVTATVPGFISIILISVLICCASRLCKIFYDLTKNNQNSTIQNINKQTNNLPLNTNVAINQVNPNPFQSNTQMKPVVPPYMNTTNPTNGIYQ